MTPLIADNLGDANAVIFGVPGMGKSGLLQLISHALALNPLEGFTAIDPHGEYVQAVAGRIANPRNGIPASRKVHIIKPGSDFTFGCNPVETEHGTDEEAHDAANRFLSLIEARFQAPPEETPRLARILYTAANVAAREGWTVVEMMQLLSLGRAQLREMVISKFDNAIVRNEFDDLQVLARRQPARFLEYVESAHSRLVRALGDKRIVRILGIKNGLNPRKIMDGREICLFDLSALNEADKAFVGALLTNAYVAAAMHRRPTFCARHRLIIDEAEALLTVDTARLVDRARKFGLNLICCIQRLGQLRAKGDFILDAMMTSQIKTCFGGLQYDDARFVALNIFGGYLNLEEWKESTRPVAVGQELRVVNHRSETKSKTKHRSYSTTDGEGSADGYGHGHISTVGSMEGWAAGEQSGSTISTDASSYYWNPFAVGTLFNIGDNAAVSSGSNNVRSGGTTRTEADTATETHVDTITHAETEAHGTARAKAQTKGESEVFVTKYQWMPTTMYSLEEQIYRVTAQLMNLPKRECIVRIGGQRPVRTRTADLQPAFRSPAFKKLLLPLFERRCHQRSPYVIPIAEADRLIASRERALSASATGFDDTIEAATATKGKPVPPKTIEGTVVDNGGE